MISGKISNLKSQVIVNCLSSLFFILIGKLLLDLPWLETILGVSFFILLFYLIWNFKSFVSKFFTREIAILIIFLINICFFSYRILRLKGYTLSLNLGRAKSATLPRVQPLPEKEVVPECKRGSGVFCTDFTAIERDFSKSEEFSLDSQNPRILRINLPKDSPSDNANLWVKNIALTPDFHFNVVAKLHDEQKGNLTIVYGEVWRCIIGEGRLDAVACEGYYSNKKLKQRTKDNVAYLSDKSRPPIDPGTEINIRGSTTFTEGNNIKISLSLEYFYAGEKKTADFDFPINYLSSNPLNDKRGFGVGIIDPEDEGIRVEFIKLELKGAF